MLSTEVVATYIQIYKDAKQSAKDAAAPFEGIMAEAKANVAEMLPLLPGGKYNGKEGSAYVPKDATVIHYDAKALDALCLSSPDLRKVLWPHRCNSTRKGSLTIR